PIPRLDRLAVAMDDADRLARNRHPDRAGVLAASPATAGGAGDCLVPGLPRDDRYRHRAGTGLRASQLLRQLRRAAGRGAMVGSYPVRSCATPCASASLDTAPAHTAGQPAVVVGRTDRGYRLRLGRPAAAGPGLGRT